MEISESIVLGVISGILTSAVIFMSVKIFNNLFIPWYRSTIYKGLDISGTWFERVEHPAAIDDLQLTLVQKGQIISGSMTVSKLLTDNQQVVTKFLDVSGTLQDGTLLLLGSSSDKRVVSHISALLRVARGGASLEGTDCWLDSGADQIRSRESDFRRKT